MDGWMDDELPLHIKNKLCCWMHSIAQQLAGHNGSMWTTHQKRGTMRQCSACRCCTQPRSALSLWLLKLWLYLATQHTKLATSFKCEWWREDFFFFKLTWGKNFVSVSCMKYFADTMLLVAFPASMPSNQVEGNVKTTKSASHALWLSVQG